VQRDFYFYFQNSSEGFLCSKEMKRFQTELWQQPAETPVSATPTFFHKSFFLLSLNSR
jgi:hypothetical protein